jgi:hypothetical protein
MNELVIKVHLVTGETVTIKDEVFLGCYQDAMNELNRCGYIDGQEASGGGYYCFPARSIAALEFIGEPLIGSRTGGQVG